MYKIIGADQKEYGPISAEQLRQWISEGRVNANTRVLAEGMMTWKAVSDLPEFAVLLPPPPPPPPLSMGHAPAGPVTNKMAVWSMVLGILSPLCCQCVLGPLAIVLGVVSLSQIKGNANQTGSGFAITGIVMGAIGTLVFIGVLIAFIHSPQFFQNLQNSLQQAR